VAQPDLSVDLVLHSSSAAARRAKEPGSLVYERMGISNLQQRARAFRHGRRSSSRMIPMPKRFHPLPEGCRDDQRFSGWPCSTEALARMSPCAGGGRHG
jgi:hypothetical protein